MVTLKLPSGQIRNVMGGTVLLPRTGIWVADLKVDQSDDLPDHVTLDLGKVEMPGTVVKAELISGVMETRLVGGGGGIGDLARPKHYHRPLVRHVVVDLLRDAGEQLSPTSTTAVMSKELEAWTTLKLPTGTMLTILCLIVGKGANWRVLADGTVWLGVETWPDSQVESRSIHGDGANAASVIGTDIPGLWPGTLLDGRRVDHVTHDLNNDRTTVLFAEGA